MQKTKVNYIPLFLFLILVLFWSNILFTDKIPFYRDIILQFYPWQIFTNEAIRSGYIPLWNPYVSCGAPFLANLQTAIFNPLKIVFYILPYSYALKFFILLNMFLAGLFSFYLCKDFKLSNYACFLSSLVFMLNGYLIMRVEFFSVFSASIWIPLIFLFIKRLFEKQRLKYLFLSSIFMSLPIFCGSVQIYFYNFILLLIYTIWFSIVFKKGILKNILILSSICVISICLSMIQLLPFIEYVFNSNRGSGLTYEVASNWSLPPLHLVSFIFPFLFGDPSSSTYLGGAQFWVMSFYIGFLPIILSFIFSGFRKQKFVFFLLGTFLFFLILSFGKYTPLFYLLYKYILPFKLIRYPATIMYVNVFLLSILTAYGFSSLEEGIIKKRYKEYFKNIFLIIFVFFAFVLIIYYSFNIFNNSIRKEIIINSLFQVMLFSLILVILYLSAIYKKIKIKTFKILLILLTVFDLFIFGITLNPLISDKIFFKKPEIVDFLEKDKSFYRIILSPRTHQIFSFKYFTEGLKEGIEYGNFAYDTKRILYDNYNMIYKIFHADGYDPLKIKEHDKVMFLLKNQKTPSETRVLDLLNVKYIISYEKIEDKNLELLTNIEGVNLYRNRNYLPRAFLVDKIKIVSNNEDAISLIKNNQFIPEEEVIKEEKEEKKEKEGKKEDIGIVDIVDYKNEEVIIKAKMFKEGILIFLDSYYPGWRVYIDGKEDIIFKANYLYRGVYLSKGEHNVKFLYKPITFKVGLYVTLIAILILTIYGIITWKKKI
jgi:hypothetical protein